MAIFFVGVTKVIGAALGYSWGIHIKKGNIYVVPRKDTGNVPAMLSSKEDLPFSKAVFCK